MRTGIGIMLNTDLNKQAREKVEIITAQLDPALIMSRFDEPISRAARQFTYKADCPVTHRMFHQVIADFVEQIYSKGLNASWKLFEPLDEAISLLENFYQSAHGYGYTAAAMDANDATQGGIDMVLVRLAEIIKDIERQKYVKAVFAVSIDPSDWYLKCEIIGILFEDYKSFLPEHLSRCKPSELVDEIPAIMYECICTDSALQQILSNPQKIPNR